MPQLDSLVANNTLDSTCIILSIQYRDILSSIDITEQQQHQYTMQLSLPLSLLLVSSLAASTVQAQINAGNTTDLTADNADGVEVARPDWQPVPSKYEGRSTWKSCDADDDCAADHDCIQHMWSYNGQLGKLQYTYIQ